MIYTIGYQNNNITSILKLMNRKNIDLLIDVRSTPYSRNPQKYEFNKNRLQHELGTRYIWMGERGGGKRGPVTSAFIESLMIHDGPGSANVLLLCLEEDPSKCHRYYDISLRLLKRGIDAVHLFNNAEIKTTEIMKGDIYG